MVPIRALAAAFVLTPGMGQAEEITVFAAASLTEAMAELERRFEAESAHEVVVSTAGSSVLARQIQQGAPADVFISANTEWMDALEADGLLVDGTRADLLRNALVLVAHGDVPPREIGADLPLAGMLGEGRMAMALVDSVPAGIYGQAALRTLGLWDGVAARIAQSDNVRTALALVATGEAPYGIVYATDAAAEDDVSVVGAFPADSHPPVVYPVAALSNGPAVSAFLAFLNSPGGREAFETLGFETVR